MLAAGTSLGAYRILAPLGAGGMGEVYRARDTCLGRDVAVKSMALHLATAPEVRTRRERVACTFPQSNPPHICTPYDIVREDNADYPVIELAKGETLAHRLNRGSLSRFAWHMRYGHDTLEGSAI